MPQSAHKSKLKQGLAAVDVRAAGCVGSGTGSLHEPKAASATRTIVKEYPHLHTHFPPKPECRARPCTNSTPPCGGGGGMHACTLRCGCGIARQES